ncbi:DUF4114 domain-containing protein [Spirulina sp. CCNP1310]|uniref:DUF4114 domain-containing protein n=1 Tax=Spirulina sp. CCNP1310 TaxID=3110249 RepID=UPI002B208120|nr:DUF4114 domain-containing protein [Spirulina sp. CCNP1310]MEA5420189.1 DUF4114 domain-containing protein [Spirulina sp. CCNP1310]
MTQVSRIPQTPDPIILQDAAQGIDISNIVNVTFVDLLEPGRLDAVVGNQSGTLHYFRNTSTPGNVSFEHIPADTSPFRELTFRLNKTSLVGGQIIRTNIGVAADFVDFNGDDLPDLIVGDGNGDIHYFENLGDGKPFEQTPTRSTFRDLGDGGVGGDDDLFLNPVVEGDDVFGILPVPRFPESGYAVPRFVEIEGDGGYHLFVGHYNRIDYYTGERDANGQLQFTKVDDNLNPFRDVEFPDVNGGTNRLVPTFANIDGDTVFDALVGQQDGTIRFFKNIGSNEVPLFEERFGLENPFDGFRVESSVNNRSAAPYLVDIDGKVDIDGNRMPEVFVGGSGINSIPFFGLERPPTPEAPIGPLVFNGNQFVFGFTGAKNTGNNLEFSISGKPASQIANIKIVVGGNSEKLFSILPGGFIPNGFPPPGKVIVDFAASKFTTGSTFTISVELFGEQGTTVVNFDSISGGSGVYQLRSTRPELGDLTITLSQTGPIPNNGLGVGVAQSQGLAVFELEKEASGSFKVYREASFTNQIGLYRVTDALTGAIGSLLPGSAGYAQAAVRSAQSLGFGLSVANQSVGDGRVTLEAGKYAPFIIVNGTFDSFLSSNPDNASGGIQAYFPFLNANPDGQVHAMVLGNNTFGFEDLFGGGDFDYNDLIVQVDFA